MIQKEKEYEICSNCRKPKILIKNTGNSKTPQYEKLDAQYTSDDKEKKFPLCFQCYKRLERLVRR